MRHAAALLLGLCAAACKETGVTVFGVMAAWEGIYLLGRYWYPRKAKLKLWERARTAVQIAYQTEGLSPLFRMGSAVMAAAAVVIGHIWLHAGAPVREWGILENDIAIASSRLERTLSYAFTHWMYAWKLLWPFRLSYDWGYSCIPHVVSPLDWRNLGPLALYTALIAATLKGLASGNAPLLRSLSLLLIPFLPAAQVAFPIGTVLAERLLYVPSLGACALIAGLCCGSFSPPQTSKHARDGGGGGKLSNGARNNFNKKKLAGSRDFGTPRACIAGALEVCPHGIKSLNNLAMTLLTPEGAGRAGELLDRALELYPRFGAAAYNRALAYSLEGGYLAADLWFERAASLDPDNAKVPLYHGYGKLTHLLPQAQRLANQSDAPQHQRDVAALRAQTLLAHATALIDKALQMGVTLPLGPFAKAQALVQAGDNAAAVEWFARAIDINAQLVEQGADNELRHEGCLGLGLAACRANDEATKPALTAFFFAAVATVARARLFAHAAALFPDDGALLTNYGGTLDRLGRHAHAQRVLRRALTLLPRSAAALNNLGWSLESSGDWEGARRHYERAKAALSDGGGGGGGGGARAQIEANMRSVEAKLARAGTAAAAAAAAP
ncbi:hypothetical protein JKP88DRAFT_308400 [Tribonema minus]|uniref:dolichyl-phosphate-mannose--protein mannosyltransferase n=1 Tax=Tribonema minus TaxID=303371 RepID=A0A836CIX5_9STRA|nr:hypothetical protein JKP88DRAFT_308400 [Tribonema minus]